MKKILFLIMLHLIVILPLHAKESKKLNIQFAGEQWTVMKFEIKGFDHPEMLRKSIPHPNRLALLKEYVELGGGLVMVGGWMSFAGIEN